MSAPKAAREPTQPSIAIVYFDDERTGIELGKTTGNLHDPDRKRILVHVEFAKDELDMRSAAWPICEALYDEGVEYALFVKMSTNFVLGVKE